VEGVVVRVSTLPPQPLPPEANGQPVPPQEQPQPSPWDQFDPLINALGTALGTAANLGAAAEDPDAHEKFAQAGFLWAQAIEKLLPQKADPAASLKVQGEMVKAGSQQAHDASQAELQREHDQMKLVQQAAVQQTTDNGATDGKRNAQ
jgi:hypothetical protein